MLEDTDGDSADFWAQSSPSYTYNIQWKYVHP